MKCPSCLNNDSKVIDSRLIQSGKSTRRRRECVKCNYRFTTYEHISINLIVKKNGLIEEFNREKLEKSIRIACNKRPVSNKKIVDSIISIEQKIIENNISEISSSYIGELVMKELHKIDMVAYIRYASVYREFKNLVEFKNQIEDVDI